MWRLAQDGHLCVGDNAALFAARSAWFPDLEWPAPLPAPLEAAAGLARRYLAVHGPATATDVAHFFGARVTSVRRCLEQIERDIAPVRCGERKGLVALKSDLPDLRRKPPGESATDAWPLRLLPLWESILMGHADKSWTVPEHAERKLVWRKAAYVAAVVMARGRVVATWSHQVRRTGVTVEVAPLSGWSPRKHLSQVRREAAALAAHLGLADAEVKVAR
jgi:hypothetical protein